MPASSIGPSPSRPASPASVLGAQQSWWLAGLLVSASACHPAGPSIDADAEIAVVVPTSEPATPILVELFVTDHYGCGLTARGEAWCWGDDPGAALGLRQRPKRWQQASALTELGTVVAIEGGPRRTCAITTGLEVLCWERPSDEHPQGIRPRRVPDLDEVIDFEVIADLCALTKAGEVVCSAASGEGREAYASHAIDLAMNKFRVRACSLTAAGEIWCWGFWSSRIVSGVDAQRGPLEVGEHGELLVARLPGAVALEVGPLDQLLVLMNSGEVLLEPFSDDLPLPLTLPQFDVVPGIAGAVALTYGGAHGCVAVRGQAQGPATQVRCFAGNGWAQLGVGDSAPRTEAVTVAGLGDVVFDVATSDRLSCASTNAGVACWGTWLPVDADADLVGPVELATGVASMAVGDGKTCVTRSDGHSSCWGAAAQGHFGDEGGGVSTAARAQPLGLELGPIAGIDGRAYWDSTGRMVYVERASGTFPITSEARWDGDGVDTCVDAYGPCCVRDGAFECRTSGDRPRPAPTFVGPTAIAHWWGSLCVVHDRGRVGCFEAPRFGEGLPPVHEVGGLGEVVQIVSDGRSGPCFAAVDVAGIVRRFCLDEDGSGMTTRLSEPLPLEPVRSLVRSGTGHCGLTRAGQVTCVSADGELETTVLSDIAELRGSSTHWCALSKAGVVTCMGDNTWGQLGRVPSSVMATPTAIEFVTAG